MNWLKIGMFGLAFVTLIGLIYAIEPDKIIDAMSEIEFSLLILAVILYLINTVIKAMRWRLIVSSTGTKLGYVEAVRLFLCGLAVNNTTPGGVSGEPLRVMLLRYKKGTPTGEGLSTIFSERLIDLTVLMCLSVSGLWFLLPILNHGDGQNLLISVGALCIILTTLLTFALHPKPLKIVIAFFEPADSKLKLMQKIHGWILQFQTGLEQLREKREIAIKAFFVTLVIWINASIRFGLIVYAVTGNVEAAGLIILASGLVYSIGTFLPFGVGNIAIATLVLSAADIDEAQAITIGIVEVATSLTLSVPMGILSMGLTGMPEEEKLD